MRHRTLGVCLAMALIARFGAALNMDQLALYLPFDEGAGKEARDLSPNNFKATLMADSGWGKGKYNGALKVANVGYAVIKDDAALVLGDTMTMEAWINIESLGDTYSSIVTKSDVFMMHLDMQGRPAKHVGVEPYSWPKVEWPPILAKNVIPLGEWHHVVGVFDGKERHVYIDGVHADASAHVEGASKGRGDVSVGYDSRGCCAARKMNALIDEVRLWNRALSAAEVKDIYSNGFAQAVQPQGKLTGYWGSLKVSR